MAKTKKFESETAVVTFNDEVEEKFILLAARAKATKPAMQLMAEFLSDPASRQRPDRFVNDDMPLGRGKGGGYQKHVKLTGLVRSVKQTSTRPAVPRVKADKGRDLLKLLRLLERWIMEGKK